MNEHSKNDFEISPFVRRMSKGVILPKNVDYKKEYGDYLVEKYNER